MPSYAIIGASRGIGLEMVRQLAAHPENTVFAVVRNADTSTHLVDFLAGGERKNVHVLEGDIIDPAATKAAAAKVAGISGGALDVLIHNAAHLNMATMYRGFLDYEDDDALDKDFMDYFKANALGIVHSMNAFLPLLRNGSAKKVAVLSSPVGQRELVWNMHMSAAAVYGTSKAAADMVLTKYAVMLEGEGFIITGIIPGLVDTTDTATDITLAKATLEKVLAKMGGGDSSAAPKPLTVEVGARRILEAVGSLQPADAGKFKPA